MGITINYGWSEPLDPLNHADVEAAERSINFYGGWFGHPILVNGDYPDVMKWRVGNRSQEQGLSESRLPAFTEHEKTLIKGKANDDGNEKSAAPYLSKKLTAQDAYKWYNAAVILQHTRERKKRKEEDVY